MTFQPGTVNYTQGFGSAPENVEVPHLDNRPPTTADVNYPIGKRWIDSTGNAEYILTSKSSFNSTVTANWQVAASGTGAVATINGLPPTAGNITIAGTAAQIGVANAGSTVTLSLIGPYTPATYTAHGLLVGEGASSIASVAVGATGTLLAGATGADPAFTASPSVTGSITAGTGITSTTGNITATAGNVAAGAAVTATTTVTAGTGVTATTGNLTATNGNLVLGTAGNKLSIATGANASTGTSTLVGGTVTVSTTAVTASSIIQLTRQSVGATGAAALGLLSVGTITAGTSFVINAWSAADATALQASDVSVIGWTIIN